MTRRLLGSVAAMLLAAGLLTSCSGDSDYCSKIKDADSNSDIVNPTTDKAKDVLQDVADSAPGEIKDDWGVFMDTLDAITGDASGVDENTMDDFTEAYNNIAEFTADECDVDLGSL